jgi:multidrug efflux pump subunit AcrA (membrane-fusion protein)
LASEWASWWPAHAVWVGQPAEGLAASVKGAGIFVRDDPWTETDLMALAEWAEIWWHAYAALHRPSLSRWRAWRTRLRSVVAWQNDRPWWGQRGLQIALAVSLAAFFPVRMTVLAPGELVPSRPAVVRAPIDGVIDVFHVQPNQQVQEGQVLFGFDELVIQSRLDTFTQALATAETDVRQTTQMAISDPRAKAQLGLLAGKAEEKRAEVDSLREHLSRARVLAPQTGVVLMDDPVEWIGKPVSTGERILRIASLNDIEIEAWVPIADAIRLQPGDQVSLYLSASPLSPVSARLRYMAHDAVQRPDGHFAYRVRATLDGTTEHRVGLKGTAKLQGDWVPLIYWMMRRPWSTVRAYWGW